MQSIRCGLLLPMFRGLCVRACVRVCVCVCLFVCLLVTTVSLTKTIEPTEMPFSGMDWGGLLGGGPDPPGRRGSFVWGVISRSINCKHPACGRYFQPYSAGGSSDAASQHYSRSFV